VPLCVDVFPHVVLGDGGRKKRNAARMGQALGGDAGKRNSPFVVCGNLLFQVRRGVADCEGVGRNVRGES